MKKLITLLLGVLLICGLCTVAYAAPEYKASIAGETLTVTITDEAGKYGDQITLQVLQKGKVIDKVNPYDDNKIVSDFIYVNQGYISEEGSYIVNINMEGHSSGNYGVRINGKEAGEIYYATTTDKNNFLRQLRQAANGAGGATDVAAKLDLENPESVAIGMFMLSDEYITKADASFVAKVLTAEIKANPTCIASPDDFVSAITHAAHIAALNDGLGSLEAFGAEFELDADALNVYTEELSAETKAAFVATYYKNKEYITNTEVEDAYYDAVILAYAKEFDSYGDAKNFIENFGEEVGIDMDDIDKLNSKNETALYEYASKLTVSDIESFVKKVNDKAEDLYDGQGSSGGGGGGGGSTFAGIGGGYTPVVSQDTISAVPTPVFSDMSNHLWAVESVNELAAKGVVSGVGEGKFEPARNVNREEMITMLIKAYGISTEGASENVFGDVPSGAWFAPYVSAAYANGYVAGTGDGTFGAGSTITRQDAAVMAYNIAKANGTAFTPTKDMFPDDKEISDYAKDAVYALKAKGIINGMGDGSFAPKASCTRAEAAKIIASLLNQ